MYAMFDSVALTVRLPEYNVPAGTRGAVVMVHGDYEAYEVEFMCGERTIALLTLLPAQLRLVQKFTPAHTTAASD